MRKQLDVIEVSKYVIYYLTQKGNYVNHLKLQKLLYYIEAWYSVFTNEYLFSDQIEAWQHGPVIRKIWDYYKKYSILYNNLEQKDKVDLEASQEQLEIINDVLDEYGDKTGYYLESLTHSEEPWQIARKKNCTYIDKNTMKQFYSKKLDEQKA